MVRFFSFLRNIPLLIMVSLVTLCAAEYFWRWYSYVWMPPQTMLSGNLNSMFEKEETFGYKTVPFSRVQVQKILKSQVLYDAAYQIDDFGWRNASRLSAPEKAWLFLGDSFTFGEGLFDQDTLNVQFEAASQQQYAAYQLAVPGYGPHQFLKMLETDTPLLYEARYDTVIYQAMPDHVFRFKGIYGWDSYGPQYTIQNDTPVYQGHFHTKWASATLDVLRVFSKLFFDCDAMITSLERMWFKSNPKTMQSYGAMVAGIERLARENYEARFIVLLWDKPALPEFKDWAELADQMEVELERRGIRVIKISDILGVDLTPYMIAADGHPNAAANQKISAALLALPSAEL